jgi:asparagine synthase (glutamine-hydrolysing)
MCGIFSVLSHDTNINYEIIKKNGMKCKHRGPDNTTDELIYKNNYLLFFMFHRLSINGLNKESNQPMTLSKYNGIKLMCNGEIYNYKNLAKKYNIDLLTKSDCEISIHLYKLLGIDECIKQLDGVFSFIIYDSIKNKYIIGHDPIGIRSLYWYWCENDNNLKIDLFVSSELKCLNELVYNNVHKIEMYPPGSYTIYDITNDTLDTVKYYKLSFNYLHDNNDIIIKNIKDKLFTAVNKRLLSDRKIGCLLSGGLDSSIITYLTASIIGSKNLKTFSIGLEGSEDLIAAQKVADYLKTDHTSIIISQNELLNAIEPTIKQIESYDITTVRASTPMYLLSKYIKENTDVVVILSGEGSDEASGSYLYFHNAPSPEEFQKESLRLINDVQYFDVLRGDKTTAGNGLEIRVPFFDKEFINYYMSINPEKKMIINGYEKYYLRKAFQNDLPKEIVWRRKEGFSDGVSSMEKPWYSIIQEHIKKNNLVNANNYNYLKPIDNESLWYRDIYEKYYPKNEKSIPYFWMPKWVSNINNPSGRLFMS